MNTSAEGNVRRQKAPRRTNEERSAETRKNLIEAVVVSLCDVGYAKTTTQEISSRAGITTGAMQHHFGSKDELVIATLDLLFSEIHVRLETIVEEIRDLALEERCRRIVSEVWGAYYGQDRYMAVWEIVVGSRGDEYLHHRVVDHRAASLVTLQAVWRRTFRSGNDLLIADTLNFTLSTLRGLALYGLVDRDPDSVSRHLKILSDTLFRLLSEAGQDK